MAQPDTDARIVVGLFFFFFKSLIFHFLSSLFVVVFIAVFRVFLYGIFFLGNFVSRHLLSHSKQRDFVNWALLAARWVRTIWK